MDPKDSIPPMLHVSQESLTERRAWELYRDYIAANDGRLFGVSGREIAYAALEVACQFEDVAAEFAKRRTAK